MKLIEQQKGQALIELIVFLPLMFMVYSLIGGFASAINGSINQQKVTRAYFYYRIQHNSTTPAPDYPDQIYKNWRQFGMFFIGWKVKFIGEDNPAMPCYKISLPISANKQDKCDESYSTQSSQFIRVGTVYGICGATYLNEGGNVTWLPNSPSANYVSVVDPSSCLIQ